MQGTSPHTKESPAIETPFTVVVPVYRGWDHAAGLVATLLRAPVTQTIEVIVVDDASGDGGADELQARFEQIRVIKRPRNGGFAAAVNTGLREASHDIFAVVNSDVELQPDALAQLVQFVAQNRAAIAGPRTVLPTGYTLATARTFPTLRSVSSELVLPLRALHSIKIRNQAARSATTPEPEPVDWVLGACLVFHRDVLVRTGYLDEDFWMYSEEVDWQLRASREGVQTYYLPGITIQHDEGHGTRASKVRVGSIWRSRTRYFRKHHGPAAPPALAALVCASFIITAPMWLAAALVPRFRDRAVEELGLHWHIVGVVTRASLRSR